MTVKAAVRTTDDNRYRVRSLDVDLPVTAEGDSREEAIENFRLEADKATRQSFEIIEIEISDPAPRNKPLTVAHSPEWHAAKGILSAEEYEHFMDAIYRRRREMDENEEKLAPHEDGGTFGDSPAWQKLAGCLADDPDADAFLEGIAARRRELDEGETEPS